MKKNYIKNLGLRNLFYGFVIAGFIGAGIFYLNSLNEENKNLKLKGTVSYVLGVGSFVLASRHNSKKKDLEFLVKGS